MLAANEGIGEFNQTRRYALGQDPLPEGMTRAEAVGKLAFNTLNVMTLGSLGDIVYGIRDEQGLRVLAGLVGIIPAIRLIRYGGALARGGIIGGRAAMQAARTSAVGVAGFVGSTWDEGLRLMRMAQADDIARAIAIFNQVGIKNEKLISLAANTIISRIDEVGDGLLAASEFWEGWKNDDLAQMTVGAIFGPVAVGGIAKNPWQQLDLESPIGRQVMNNIEAMRRATPEVIALFESRGMDGLTVAFRHGDVAQPMLPPCLPGCYQMTATG